MLDSPSPNSHLPPVQPRAASRLTSLARSMPSSPGQSAASLLQRVEVELARRRDARSRSSAAPRAAPAGSARACRRRKCRSAPSPHPAGKSCSARKLVGAVTASRTRQPSACASAASTSSSLAPTLPMCGKVKATTCLRVGRVGHHFLVTGHGGVEAQLADRLALGAEAPAPDRPAIGEDHDARRALRLGGADEGRASAMGGRSLSVEWFAAMSLSDGR